MSMKFSIQTKLRSEHVIQFKCYWIYFIVEQTMESWKMGSDSFSGAKREKNKFPYNNLRISSWSTTEYCTKEIFNEVLKK